MLTNAQLQNQTASVTPRFIADYLTWAWEGRLHPQTTFPVVCYRGHGESSWDLLPTLCRTKKATEILRQIESEILTAFRARFDLANWSDIEVLAYARHHGAPTRLLDWSRNPLIGVWFAVSDKNYDGTDGSVYQLSLMQNPSQICVALNFELARADKCKCGLPVHLFESSHKIDRTKRQGSVFTITTFDQDAASKPLDKIVNAPEKPVIRKFPIPAAAKARLRTGLAELGLDAYSLYGDPDSFGEQLSALFAR